jgi:hypothetical protein
MAPSECPVAMPAPPAMASAVTVATLRGRLNCQCRLVPSGSRQALRTQTELEPAVGGRRADRADGKSSKVANRLTLDRHAGAIAASIKKPPGHDSARPPMRLPVSRFRRCHHNRRAAQRFREAMSIPLQASASVSHIALSR